MLLTDRNGDGRSTVRENLRGTLSDFIGRSPSRFALAVFALLIAIVTSVLMLPAASATGRQTPLADALFTAVSAICVTGLSTVDMATHWSGFGHVVIYLAVQVGGIGVLTLASILGLVISRRLGLRAKLIAASDSNPLRAHSGPVSEAQAVRLGDVGSLLATVAVSAVVIETVIALLLLPSVAGSGIPPLQAVSDSFYYSAMAFTNTGFTPNADGLAPFADNPFFLTPLMVAVVAGAIGFPVIYACVHNARLAMRRRRLREALPIRWTVHVKITVVAFAVLLVVGAVLYLSLEADNPRTFGGMGAGETVFQSLFLSVMARSGGFSTVDVSSLHGSSLLVTDMLMFIGGGSASTAGGIKVTTLAVLFLAAFAEARGVEQTSVFRRGIPTDVLRVAVSVVLWGATIVAVSTVVVLQITKDSLDRVLFDVISAFATCGLSTGVAADAPDAAVYVLAATMFMGRIGTVTLAAAVAQSSHRRLYTLPEERPIVG